MLERQNNLIQQLQSEVGNVCDENEKLRQTVAKRDSRKTDRFGKLYNEREILMNEGIQNLSKEEVHH